MKVTKLFTLDLELVELLKKEDNMSGLINDLLNEHYYKTPNNRRLGFLKRLKELKEERVYLDEQQRKLELELKEILEQEKEKVSKNGK